MWLLQPPIVMLAISTLSLTDSNRAEHSRHEHVAERLHFYLECTFIWNALLSGMHFYLECTFIQNGSGMRNISNVSVACSLPSSGNAAKMLENHRPFWLVGPKVLSCLYLATQAFSRVYGYILPQDLACVLCYIVCSTYGSDYNGFRNATLQRNMMGQTLS